MPQSAFSILHTFPMVFQQNLPFCLVCMTIIIKKRQENKAKMNSAKDHFLGRFQPFKMTLGCPEIRDSEMPIKSTKFQQFASF